MNNASGNIVLEEELNRISKFYYSTFEKRSRFEVIDAGLKIYKDYFDCTNISLFMLNKNTFDFNHFASLKHNEETATILFERLSDKGGITACLEAGSATFYSLEDHNFNYQYLYIIPLIGTFGVLGITIIELKENHPIDDVQNLFVTNYSNIFSLILENHNMIVELQTEKEKAEERKQLSQTVNVQSTKDLKNILDRVQVGIMLVNVSNKKIVDVNEMASTMIGSSKEFLIDQEITKYLYSLGPQNRSNEFIDNQEGLLKKENGTLVSVLRKSSRVEINNEEFYLESFIDITHRKKMEDELQKSHFKLEQRVEERTNDLRKINIELNQEIDKRIEAEFRLVISKEKAEESNRIKTALLANMSHEFRTPLISILGFSEVLAMELEDAEQKEMTKDIMSAGQRLLKTLDGVLHLSQLQTNTYPVNFVQIEITGLIKEISERFITKFQEKNLAFKINIKSEQIYLIIDPDLLSIALNNILDNALKYTEYGEIVLNLEIKSIDENKIVSISISDTGMGVAENDYEVIFEEFRQTDEGYKRNYEGCGLGLTLAKRMIELIDGTIQLESYIGKGSTFTILFTT
ncbi:MAG: ATP-binding protein [Ignavibacteriales bacterium]|nr:ATP-binding protein [Ignavibacteriales bacterium]